MGDETRTEEELVVGERDDEWATSVWFKAWFAFCAVVGVGVLGVGVWAVIRLVTWATSR